MSTFKQYFTYDCISYTILMMIECTLASVQGHREGIDANVAIQMFLMTILISVVMFLTDKIQVASFPLRALIDVADIARVGYPLGLWWGFFEADAFTLVGIFLVILTVYAGVVGISLIRAKSDEGKINRELRARRERGEKR